MRMYLVAAVCVLVLGACTREKSADELAAEATAKGAATAAASASANAITADLNADARREAAAKARAQLDAEEQRKRDAERMGIAQAASNLAPLAKAADIRGESGISQGISTQKVDIDRYLNLSPSEYPAPTITAEGLLRDAQAELAKSRVRADELVAELRTADAAAQAAQEARAVAEREAATADAAAKKAREEREAADIAAAKARAAVEAATARADAADTESRWAKVGAGALTALGVLATLAARLNLPGGGIAKLVFDLARPGVAKGREVAETAVAGADVGRAALSAFESMLSAKNPKLAAELGNAVAAATGGRVNGLHALFVTAAKSYVTDNVGEHVANVDQLLLRVRGEDITTQAGIPTTVTHLLKG